MAGIIVLYFSKAAEQERVKTRNINRKPGEPSATYCGQFAITPKGRIPFTFAVHVNDLATPENSKKILGATIVGRVPVLEIVTPTH